MKKSLRKLNTERGFTLTETLVAVLILVMISASALPAALNAYRNAVDAANAQVLLSTTVNALRDELSLAWDVQVCSGDNSTGSWNFKDDPNGYILYKSSDTGSESKIYRENSVIMLQEYNDFSEKWYDQDTWDQSVVKKQEGRPLVSNAMRRSTGYADPMTVTFKEVSIADNCITFTDLLVERNGRTIAKMPASGLVIRLNKGGEDA